MKWRRVKYKNKPTDKASAILGERDNEDLIYFGLVSAAS